MGSGIAAVATVVPRVESGRRAELAESAAVFVCSAVGVFGIAAANGGYFSASWSWATIGLAWAVAAAFALRQDIVIGRAGGILIAGLAGLAAWMLISLAWAPSGAPVFEAERTLLYLAGAAAVVVGVRRRTVSVCLGGVLAGLTAVAAYGLATRLLPDRFGSYDPLEVNRLTTPIGYWNGVGLAAAFALLLAVGLSARAESAAGRALSAASLPVLAPTLYFTFSRGSWLALAVGAGVLLALDARRLQLVAVAGPAALAAAAGGALAWHAAALSTQGTPVAEAAAAGHLLAQRIVVLSGASLLLSLAATAAARRLRVGRSTQRLLGGLLLAAALVVAAAGLARVGGPLGATERAWHSFRAKPISVGAGSRESDRLFSLSSNGRTDLWRAAWAESLAHPLLGGGAGSYESWWLRHRTQSAKVRDAHSLYLQILAELGPLGLLLLLVALVTPLAAAVAGRTEPLVPAAAAAYVAFLVHAAGDWDWQLAGVTLPAVAVGAAILVARRGESRSMPRRLPRTVGLSLACVVGVLGFLMVAGNVPLTSARAAAAAADWPASAREARSAIRWLPWSADGWRLLGEADLARRRRAPAAVALRHGLALEPGNWQLWFDLAAATRGAESRRALARASALDPLSPEIAQLRSPGS